MIFATQTCSGNNKRQNISKYDGHYENSRQNKIIIANARLHL